MMNLAHGSSHASYIGKIISLCVTFSRWVLQIKDKKKNLINSFYHQLILLMEKEIAIHFYSCQENPMEPGRLQSIGSQKFSHDWSDLAHK